MLCFTLNMKVKDLKKGFTLVEIMIVVAIIGLLAALGIPSFLKARTKSRANRFAKEIKTAAHAFIQYSFENGSYPADVRQDLMPEGMTDYLAGFSWEDDTVIGGQWDWDYEQFGTKAAVSVYGPNWDTEQMQVIDKVLDDGNLSTGQFRARTGGYMYVIEEMP